LPSQSKPAITLRRPPPADPARRTIVDKFVSGDAAEAAPASSERPAEVANDADTAASGAEATPARSPSSRRGIVERRDGRVLRRLTVYLPPDLARTLVVRAAGEGVDVSELAEQAFREFIGPAG
jgi:hypothetical protein